MTSNVFLVDGDRPVLVDVGSDFDVVAEIERHGSTIEAVVLTHTHPDHIGNVDAVTGEYGVDVWGFDPSHPAVDHGVEPGDELQLGSFGYEVLHTPGHKDDHVCLFSRDSGVLFAGDLVFANGGFGRTDLPEGNRQVLIASIELVLETVGTDLETFHCGHGPSVTSSPRKDIELALQAAKF